jgi:hypothetical protein
LILEGLAQRKKEALAARGERLSRVRVLEAILRNCPTFSPGPIGDGSPRLFPALGPRQSPPSVQALRMGREEEQNLVAETVDYDNNI